MGIWFGSHRADRIRASAPSVGISRASLRLVGEAIDDTVRLGWRLVALKLVFCIVSSLGGIEGMQDDGACFVWRGVTECFGLFPMDSD